jgi:hypothetical protein
VKGKSITAVAAMLAVVFLGAAGCDITPGSSCSAEGSKHTNKDGRPYVCRQVPGGNRIWQDDVALTPDRP